ncbi:MAG: XTP/dITP diphosphohydrolase [Gaiellales bacterium]|jgi:XTP/dITP diphosphohydrolase|nr:XTP/dITP diphosphohydrolase [Gaiellales bacterium]MDX6619651.1 XTP/dITP diphosphohydrolase [Gaiellales bacterium]
MSRLRAVLATGNAGKAAELSRLLGAEVEAQPLEVAEDADSYAGNALLKARAALAVSGGRIGLGDDSGIEVASLGGQPGLHSARWTGPGDADRNAALLARLEGAGDRSAAFVCVLAAALPDGREILAEGRVEGDLAQSPRGEGGFGYDPLFVPRGDTRTVAELSAGEKDGVSHRGRAARALVAALREAGVA